MYESIERMSSTSANTSATFLKEGEMKLQLYQVLLVAVTVVLHVVSR